MTFSSFISSELIRTCQLDIFLSPQSGHFIYLNLKMFANLQQSSVGDFIPKYATAFVQSDKYKYIISSLDVNKRQRKYRGGKKLSAVQICTVDGFISPRFLYVQNGSLIYLLWWPIKKCFSVSSFACFFSFQMTVCMLLMKSFPVSCQKNVFYDVSCMQSMQLWNYLQKTKGLIAGGKESERKEGKEKRRERRRTPDLETLTIAAVALAIALLHNIALSPFAFLFSSSFLFPFFLLLFAWKSLPFKEWNPVRPTSLKIRATRY